MYISVREQPTAPTTTDTSATPGRYRVAPVVISLGLVSLLTDISSESVSAILPLYLTVGLGFSTMAYGFVDGLYQGISSLVRIAGGWAADRGGRPKWVAFAGYAFSCLARFAMLFTTGLATISLVVSADRIGKGLRTAPRDAMISAATPPEHLGRAFGVHRALDTTGAVIGPLIAFALLWWIPDGYVAVLVVSLAFAVLGVALLGLLVSDRPTTSPTTSTSTAGPTTTPPAPARPAFRWSTLADRRLARLLAVAGVLGLLTVGDGFLYLALLDRGGFATHWFPLMYVGTNIAYLALAVPAGRVADRVGRARVLVLGHVALLAAYLCAAAPVAGAATTLGALLLLGVFYAATDGVLAAIAGHLVDPSVRASGIAAAQTTVALARMGSSAAFGVLWFLVGPTSALLLVGALLVLAVPVAFRTVRGLDLTSATAPTAVAS